MKELWEKYYISINGKIVKNTEFPYSMSEEELKVLSINSVRKDGFLKDEVVKKVIILHLTKLINIVT